MSLTSSRSSAERSVISKDLQSSSMPDGDDDDEDDKRGRDVERSKGVLKFMVASRLLCIRLMFEMIKI